MKNRLKRGIRLIGDSVLVAVIGIGFASLLVAGIAWASDTTVVRAHAIMPLFIQPPPLVAPPPPPVEEVEGIVPSGPFPTPTEDADPASVSVMQAYILKAMTEWSPAKTMPKKDISQYADIAHDIAAEVLSPSEKTLFIGDSDKHRSSILIADLGFFEGRYLRFVDDGSCNNDAWRKAAWKHHEIWAPNICDGGHAFTLWQIHDEGGLVLTPDGEWWHHGDVPSNILADLGEKKLPIVVGPDMVNDRRLAVRVALAFVRKSLRVSHGLCGYTGDGANGCSKATTRMRFATAYLQTHPFDPAALAP